MATEGIFSRYHAALFTHMPAYLRGEIELDEAVRRVVEHLSTPPATPED